MRAGALAFLAVLLLQGTRAGSQAIDLQIRVIAPETRVELGQPLPLQLDFANAGEESFYLKRPQNYAGLNVFFRRGTCEYSLGGSWSERVRDEEPLWIPLASGDRFVQQLVPIDDPGFVVDLPGPGTFSLHVTFRSEGPAAEGSRRRVWRGFVVTPEVAVTFLEPSKATLERMRTALRISGQTGEPDFDALYFFRLVKDAAAADDLIQLLARWDVNQVVLDAIAPSGSFG